MDISCFLWGNNLQCFFKTRRRTVAQSFVYSHNLVPQFPCNTRNYCDKTESIGPYNKGKTAHENLNQPTKNKKEG